MQCIRRNLANALRDHLQSHPSARGTLQSHLDVYTYERYRARVIPNTRTIKYNISKQVAMIYVPFTPALTACVLSCYWQKILAIAVKLK